MGVIVSVVYDGGTPDQRQAAQELKDRHLGRATFFIDPTTLIKAWPTWREVAEDHEIAALPWADAIGTDGWIPALEPDQITAEIESVITLFRELGLPNAAAAIPIAESGSWGDWANRMNHESLHAELSRQFKFIRSVDQGWNLNRESSTHSIRWLRADQAMDGPDSGWAVIRWGRDLSGHSDWLETMQRKHLRSVGFSEAARGWFG